MRILALSVLMLLVNCPGYARQLQPSMNERQAWLQEHVVAVESIDAAQANWEDLEPLADQIGNARIVELIGFGQADEGASYDAMHRLIRFLHQRMGFDVLVWPVGIFEGAEMERHLYEGASVEKAAATLYSVWRQSKHVLPVLDYARSTQATARPLNMPGTLTQFHRVAKDRYAQHLTDFLDSVDPSFLTATHREAMDALWTRPQRIRDLPAEQRARASALAEELLHLFDEAVPALQSRYSPQRVTLERNILKNMITFVELEERRANAETEAQIDNLGAFIDSVAAINFLNMAEGQYRDRKMILWNGRQGARDAFPDQVFSLAFTAYQGVTGRPNRPQTAPLNPAPAGSLEALLHAQALPYALLNLRPVHEDETHWLHDPNSARMSAKFADTEPWTKRLDAIFFIDTVYPNAPLDE